MTPIEIDEMGVGPCHCRCSAVGNAPALSWAWACDREQAQADTIVTAAKPAERAMPRV